MHIYVDLQNANHLKNICVTPSHIYIYISPTLSKDQLQDSNLDSLKQNGGNEGITSPIFNSIPILHL